MHQIIIKTKAGSAGPGSLLAILGILNIAALGIYIMDRSDLPHQFIKLIGIEGLGAIAEGFVWFVVNLHHQSLGADVRRPHPPYSVAGRRALRRGSLIIAAAGNNASRPDDPGFVGSPANSPDIMAVGALDSRLRVASFSARTLPGRGGQVDIAGPGVGVYSAWPMPTRYQSISGTSMACPHVSGTAALAIAAGVGDVRGKLQSTADDLGVTGWDRLYGYGLVDAEEVVSGP